MYWKVLTHDYRSPIQGGEPLFNGTLPYRLPVVRLDVGPAECAAGWNFTDNLATALRIGGSWPDGWPSTAFEVEPSADMIQRDDKHRASSLRLVRAATAEEVSIAVLELSAAFGTHAETMCREQMAWRGALARPQRDPVLVLAGLKTALNVRSLDWTVKKFGDARNAWDAWDAQAAQDAWAALTVYYASLMQWITDPPDLLTVGIRDAYSAGLVIALPTGPQELGYAMLEK